MIDSSNMGLVQDPSWGTRPVDIPEGRWRQLQDNLYPNLISITMLDGIKDDLEFRIEFSNEIDHNLLYSTEAVQASSPLLESQHLWVIAGISLTLIGIVAENRRRKNAKQILNQMVSENMWN
jgi:hypothetical protein